jgi:RNA polymerase sigma-70 factor, ECF subfamily
MAERNTGAAPPDGGGSVPSDVELVLRAREGDTEAFEQVFARHHERVLRLVYSVLRNPMDTEEVAQDVFLTVFQKIQTFRGDSSFTTWLHRIAVNAALMHRRRVRRASTEISLEDVLPAFESSGHIAVDVPDWTPQADDPAVRRETRAVIEAAVDGLDPKYQTVFLLRDVEELSTEETAEVLELSVAAVKSRLHRARLYLRRQLADYFGHQAET